MPLHGQGILSCLLEETQSSWPHLAENLAHCLIQEQELSNPNQEVGRLMKILLIRQSSINLIIV